MIARRFLSDRNRPRGRAAACAILVSVLLPDAPADTLHVPGDHPTIQEAIDAAVTGDEIVVATGTYVETIDFLGKGVLVRSAAPQHMPTVMSTIIDGGGAAPVVRFASGESSLAVLRGVYITGGDGAEGGGVLIAGASPVIDRCVVGVCRASVGSAVAVLDGSPRFVQCSFSNNAGLAGPDAGGTVTVFDGAPRFEHCMFARNKAAGDGGAARVLGGSAHFVDCRFIANRGIGAGGAAVVAGGSAFFTACAMLGNETPGPGGAIDARGGVVVLDGCLITDGLAGTGGGLAVGEAAVVQILDSAILGNTADSGGGIAVAGSGPYLARVSLCANEPEQVAGPFVDGGDVHLSDDPCLAPQIPVPADMGLCCLPLSCVETTLAQCRAAGGVFLGSGADCADCPAACLADLNGDGTVDVLDLLVVLAWM